MVCSMGVNRAGHTHRILLRNGFKSIEITPVILRFLGFLRFRLDGLLLLVGFATPNGSRSTHFDSCSAFLYLGLCLVGGNL